MTEFWEKNFKEKQEMWGLQPANSAVITSKLFAENKYKTILIPGVGYGRNAQAFIAQGMDVTGIEISKTAIELAEKEFGQSIKIYHGSVKDMPFDDEFYDGVFSHALIHLLDKNDRINMISACYN